MKRVAVYVRVSTAGQEDEETIDNQLMELRQRITQDGHILLSEHIYSDNGWTGTLLERPELDRLRTNAKGGAFNTLYVYDRGRISRKFVHQEVVLEELENAGIETISLHDINGTTPEEMLMGSVMGIFHEYERLKITERMRLGKVRKVRENGKLLGYNPPYGYDYHHRVKGGPDARDGYFTVNEEEAKVIQQVFEWVATGTSTYGAIKKLHELGIPPKKKKRAIWTKGPMTRMLTNETYIGSHYYNKTEAVETKNPRDPNQKYRRVKKGSRIARPRDEWLLVEAPRIISDDLFNKVQEQLKQNKQFSPRNNKKNEYLLTGLMECECGKARTGEAGGGNHLYYRCTDRLSQYPLPRTCYSGGVNVVVLDSLVWGQVKELMSSPTLIRAQAERWLDGNNLSPARKDLEDAEHELAGIEDEEKRYAKAYALSYLSEKVYVEQMDEVMARKALIEDKKAQAEKTLQAGPVSLSVDELVEDTLDILNDLDFTDKKAIIRQTVNKIKATPQEAVIWGNLPIRQKEEVGFESKYRYRRPSQCRQINPIQRPH